MATLSNPHDPTPIDKDRSIDTILIYGGGFLIFLALAALATMLLTPALEKQATTIVVKPEEAPTQVTLETAEPITLFKGGYTWTLTPRADFTIAARVIGSKWYHDWQSVAVPLDLALGWGEMSDTAVDEYIHWRQAGRWYYYSWEGSIPYSRWDVRDQSANVHIIPATENLAQALKTVQSNDVILLEGMLVDVTAAREGATTTIPTSLTRTDSGAGACEIIYVEKLIRNGEEFQ